MENRRTGLIIGVGAGCLLLCLMVVVGGVVILVQVTEPPDDVVVDLVVPSDVRINEDLTIDITIQNTLQETRVLKEIEIDSTYTDGIFIHDSQPAFYDTGSGSNYQTYSYDDDISPNGSITIQLYATAIQTGTFTGQIAVCIDSELSCLEYPMHTRVRQQ